MNAVIYAGQITINAGDVAEVVASLSAPADRYEVIVQLVGTSANGPVVALCQDAAGALVGPFLNLDSMGDYSGPGLSSLNLLSESTFRFFTNKDPVYLKATLGSGSVVVAAALIPVP